MAKLLTTLLALSGLASLCTCLGAGTSGVGGDDNSWATVEQIKLGQSLRVVCSGERTWKGSLVRVSDDTLVLGIGGTERKVVRSEVFRIDVKGRAKAALIGLGIGAAGGLGLSYAMANSSDGIGGAEIIAAGAVWGGAIGAGIGAARGCWKTVYRGAPASSKLQNGLALK
jgi:hypothetical protein